MTFERSDNLDIIKSVVTHKNVYPAVSDDFSPEPQDWEPIDPRVAWYVVVKDGETLLGLWALIPVSKILWQIHTCLLPVAYGERARAAAKELGPWIWDHMPCMRVITEVPAYNRLALRFAKEAGMTQFGLNPKSYQKFGQLHDVALLGVSRPEGNVCQ